MCKVEELLKDNKLTEKLSMAKLNDLFKKEEEEKKPSKAVIIFAIIGVLVAVAAAAYGIYRLLYRSANHRNAGLLGCSYTIR